MNEFTYHMSFLLTLHAVVILYMSNLNKVLKIILRSCCYTLTCDKITFLIIVFMNAETEKVKELTMNVQFLTIKVKLLLKINLYLSSYTSILLFKTEIYSNEFKNAKVLMYHKSLKSQYVQNSCFDRK